MREKRHRASGFGKKKADRKQQTAKNCYAEEREMDRGETDLETGGF